MTPGTLSGDVSPICNVELSHEACQFVGLGDLQALASLLDTTPGALRDITRSADNYVAFTARTGGKLRAVTAPRPRLDEMQRRIHDHLATLRPPDYLHSGIRGRSHVTHAAGHRCGQWLCKLDLRHFFFQVTTARVQRFFQDRMRCAADVAALLADLCTTDGHLPIGARISQQLAFLVAKPMFDDLQRFAKTVDVHFTAYVDDLCFSGARATPAFLWEVKKIVHRHGYRYHAAKCYRPGQPRLVAGAMLIDDGLRLRPRDVLRIRQELLALDDPAIGVDALLALQGRLAAAASIDERYRSRLNATKARLRTLREARSPTGDMAIAAR
jgi:hypothetical protein